MDPEKGLIEGCIKGDRKSQKAMFDRFSRSMMVVSMRYSKSDLEAEDILQEAFIKVFEKIHTFRGECKLEFWIKRIVVNTALNYGRSKLYMFPMVDVEQNESIIDEDFSLANFHFKDLLGMIQSLPSGCQVIFNLYAIEGYSHKEIAEVLQIEVSTSRSQLVKARRMLQRKIEDLQKIAV